jgi:DNA-binding IclR family transcriptional regulator
MSGFDRRTFLASLSRAGAFAAAQSWLHAIGYAQAGRSVAGQTGEFAPLHCTAHGKALLADWDLQALRQLLGRAPLQAYTRRTLKSVARLALACAQARAEGFALDDGEYIEEVGCLAAPIRDPLGEIVASVGISVPLMRLRTRGVARAAAQVKKTARAISASLAS